MPYNGNWEGFFKNTDGTPLRLFHGTAKEFVYFDLEQMVDVGIHFGCDVQASHFAAKPGGRVFPAFIRSVNYVDVGNRDFGWKWPHQTVRSLENVIHQGQFLFSAADTRAVGLPPGLSMGQAYDRDCDFINSAHDHATLMQKCRAVNRKIETRLRAKEIDCIIYTNRNEPDDGIGRDAYLVFDPSNIVSAIDKEILGQ